MCEVGRMLARVHCLSSVSWVLAALDSLACYGMGERVLCIVGGAWGSWYAWGCVYCVLWAVYIACVV